MKRKDPNNMFNLEMLDRKYSDYKIAKKAYEDELDKNVIIALKMKRHPDASTGYIWMMSYGDIAKYFGISKSKVQRIAKKYNLDRHKKEEK